MNFAAVKALRGCAGAVVVVQRQPHCKAVRASLQHRKALTAKPKHQPRPPDAFPPF